MILIKYQKSHDLRHILQINIEKQKLSFKDLAQTLKAVDLDILPIHLPFEHLNQVNCSFIANVTNEHGSHFVLVYKKRKKYLLIADPADDYLKKMSLSNFRKIFCEKAILINQKAPKVKRSKWQYIPFTFIAYIELLLVIFSMIILALFFEKQNLKMLFMLFALVLFAQQLIHFIKTRMLIEKGKRCNEKEKKELVKKLLNLENENYINKAIALSRLNDFDFIRNFYLEFELVRYGDIFIAIGTAITLIMFNYLLASITIAATISLVLLYILFGIKNNTLAKKYLKKLNCFEDNFINNQMKEVSIDEHSDLIHLEYKSEILSHRLSTISLIIRCLLNLALLALATFAIIKIEDYFIFLTLLEFYLSPVVRLLKSLFLAKEVVSAKTRILAIDFLTQSTSNFKEKQL